MRRSCFFQIGDPCGFAFLRGTEKRLFRHFFVLEPAGPKFSEPAEPRSKIARNGSDARLAGGLLHERSWCSQTPRVGVASTCHLVLPAIWYLPLGIPACAALVLSLCLLHSFHPRRISIAAQAEKRQSSTKSSTKARNRSGTNSQRRTHLTSLSTSLIKTTPLPLQILPRID